MRRRYKFNKMFFLRFIIIIAAVAVGVILLITFLNTDKKEAVFTAFEAEKQEEQTTYEVYGVPVIQSFLPEGYAGRPGLKRDIKYIVIHETANTDEGADAKRHNEYLLNEAKETEISWHYTVDDHEIYQNLPDDEVGWHAGDRQEEPGGNINGIGVEICVNGDGNFKNAKENAVKLCVYLMEKYGLNIDDVKQHNDFMDKNCPQIIRESGQWDDFLNDIKNFEKEENV